MSAIRAVRRFWAGHMWQATAGATVLVAGCVTIVATAFAGSGAAPARASAGNAAGGPVAPVPVSAAEFARLPRATTFASTPAAPADPAPAAVTDGLVVHPQRPVVVYAGPGKAAVAVLPVTELGAPTWVPIVQSGPGWERVLLPSRPNGATGWIYKAGTSSLVTEQSTYLVRIGVGARKLSIYNDGSLAGTWTVTVGAPKTPTPTGRTFVLALLAPPHPTYSPLILPLGFHSDTFDTFGGGPGTVGLHGWPDPSVFGHAVSHGCVRVPKAALKALSKVPLGSIVLISP